MRSFFIASCLLLLSAFTLNSHAARLLPPGCHAGNFSFEKGSLLLNTKDNKQRLFFIYNTTKGNVELAHYGKQTFFNNTWQTYLGKGLVSAFAVDERNYEIACGINKGREIDQVPCENVISVCDFTRARFELSNNGSYWVTENKYSKHLIYELRRKGIRLRRIRRR